MRDDPTTATSFCDVMPLYSLNCCCERKRVTLCYISSDYDDYVVVFGKNKVVVVI